MTLVKLSDTDVRLQEPWQDIRGRDVYDVDGDKMGTVDELYVDDEAGEVRALTVDPGGFLDTSIGSSSYRMFPIEAVRNVSDDGVTVNFNPDKVAG